MAMEGTRRKQVRSQAMSGWTGERFGNFTTIGVKWYAFRTQTSNLPSQLLAQARAVRQLIITIQKRLSETGAPRSLAEDEATAQIASDAKAAETLTHYHHRRFELAVRSRWKDIALDSSEHRWI